MDNSICEHINSRYDRKQMAMQQALAAYHQDMELCMMFDRVNNQPRPAARPVPKRRKRDFASGFGYIMGLSAMALFLVFGVLLGI